MILTCMIIDDEPLAIRLLEEYVNKTPYLKLIASLDNPIEAVEAYTQSPVDLVFLDIQMPELSGLELSRVIQGKTRIIFTTAFKQYAFESYELNAIDYLLKPISFQAFLKASNKALQWFELIRKEKEEVVSPPSAPVPQTENSKSLFVKTDYKLVRVDMDKILYISSLKDYVQFYIEGEVRSIISLMTMKAVEDMLPPDRFIRVHRSYIISLDKIKAIENNRIIIGKEYIPISDAYKEKFNSFLANYSIIKK
ncbi:LytTR family DNA-binding domain-containing protein [Parabacteroides sp. OttesenSCG-928-G07]|nr:LytTR family DNA-binding domain-containing protein [Parabacteroides sp. OttesenSCG-928-G07]